MERRQYIEFHDFPTKVEFILGEKTSKFSFLLLEIDQTNRVKQHIAILNMEGSIKSVNFMTPGYGFLFYGVAVSHIVKMHHCFVTYL